MLKNIDSSKKLLQNTATISAKFTIFYESYDLLIIDYPKT